MPGEIGLRRYDSALRRGVAHVRGMSREHRLRHDDPDLRSADLHVPGRMHDQGRLHDDDGAGL
jgi:hypothetical protein